MKENNRKKFLKPLESIKKKGYYFPILFALNAGTIFLAYFQPVSKAIKSGDKLPLIGLIVLFGFLSILGIYLSRSKKEINPPDKGIFRGPGELRTEDVWPRHDEANRLYGKILKLRGKPLFLVGPSGVGKSTLFEKEVWSNRLKQVDKWHGILINNYSDIRSLLFDKLVLLYPNLSQKEFFEEGKLETTKLSLNLIISFDQFEKFLFLYPEKDINSYQIRKWLNDLIKNTSKFNHIRLVFIVRKEWYFDLKILLESIPEELFPLSGIKAQIKESELLKRLRSVTRNDLTARTILESLIEDGEILPIEAQIVGLMVENKGKTGEVTPEYYTNTLGGKEGLIQQYFSNYIDASPDRGISLKILTALSVETSLRIQYSQSEIADIIHGSIPDVCKCLKYLCDHGLIREDIKYELSHDYLAQKLHEYSGGELSPEERDNIIYFWDELRSIKREQKLKSFKMLGRHLNKKRELIFGKIPAYLVYILVPFRILGPLFGLNWAWFNPLFSHQLHMPFLDIYYFPVGASHVAWTIYTTSFFKNFLVYLDEKHRERLFSNFIPIFSSILVVICLLVPHFWVFLIGIGGLPVGLKLYMLSKQKGLPNVSSEFFRKTGISTIINVTVTALLGVVLIYFVHTFKLSSFVVERLNIIYLFICFVMIYFMILVKSRHSDKGAAAKMMGLIDRGRIRINRSKTGVEI